MVQPFDDLVNVFNVENAEGMARSELFIDHRQDTTLLAVKISGLGVNDTIDLQINVGLRDVKVGVVFDLIPTFTGNGTFILLYSRGALNPNSEIHHLVGHSLPLQWFMSFFVVGSSTPDIFVGFLQ